MLVVEWTCIKGFVQVLKVPKHILLPLILVLCCVGAYATNNRIFDVQSILIFGLVGYIYHKFSLPTTPFVLCFLIGEMLETYLRRGIIVQVLWCILCKTDLRCILLYRNRCFGMDRNQGVKGLQSEKTGSIKRSELYNLLPLY